MTLDPFTSAPIAIQIQMAAALIAVCLGPFALYRKRRDRLHRRLGHVWVTAMAVLALSAFTIPSQFSPIRFGVLHGFAVLTLLSLWVGVAHAIRRNIVAHEALFRSLYSNGLLIVGVFNFLPGRTINRIDFGGPSDLGWIVIAAALVWVAVRVLASFSQTGQRG